MKQSIIAMVIITLIPSCVQKNKLKCIQTDFVKVKSDVLKKNIKGCVFSTHKKSKIDILFYSDSIEVLNFYDLEDNKFKLLRSDTLYRQYYHLDTIIDINSDGINEFLLYQITGMGIKEYSPIIYMYKSEKIQVLNTLNQFPNLNFQPENNTFTSFDNDSDHKVGRKYKWVNGLEFEEIERIYIDCDEDANCIKRKYSINGKEKKLIYKNNSLLMDNEYWGIMEE